MNVLVIGQGGREHALVRALRHSPSLRQSHSQVHVVPGSDGIALEARCHALPWESSSELNALHELIRREEIELVVVGPEVPLANGVSDALRAQGIAVFGPDAAGARLEASKIHSKEFMVEAGVRTARFRIVDSVASTRAVMGEFTPPYVLKADGLAAGKGVFICKTEQELLDAARSIFEERTLGEAGTRALLEQFQPGYEISYLILTNGVDFEPLVLAQDHKRLFDGDQGPNTGGMGVVAPVSIDPKLQAEIDREIVQPVLKAMQKRGFLYRGVLYIGLMMTDDGPSVLEFNVRFGDPEAQALLPLLDGDWAEVFSEIACGRVPKLRWKNAASACVVLAAEGYPDNPLKGAPIEGDLAGHISSIGDGHAYLIHAGTKAAVGANISSASSGFVVAGGRVLNAVGVGTTLAEALAVAYKLIERVNWSGMQFRRDIGAKVLAKGR